MVYQDRHNWQTRLKKILGFEPLKHQTNKLDSSDTDDSFQLLNKNKNLFKITVPFDTFSKTHPITLSYKDKHRGYRYYDVLKPHMWTDVINDLFVKKYILPCNFTYKRVKVTRDSYKSEKFLVFEAHCKDCGSELKGWADSKPKEE